MCSRGKTGCLSGSLHQEAFMDVRATAVNDSKSSNVNATPAKTPRGAWVLTAYGISGLALFGVLAYFFSSYVAH
jgi:hypothetical protein